MVQLNYTNSSMPRKKKANKGPFRNLKHNYQQKKLLALKFVDSFPIQSSMDLAAQIIQGRKFIAAVDNIENRVRRRRQYEK